MKNIFFAETLIRINMLLVPEERPMIFLYHLWMFHHGTERVSSPILSNFIALASPIFIFLRFIPLIWYRMHLVTIWVRVAQKILHFLFDCCSTMSFFWTLTFCRCYYAKSFGKKTFKRHCQIHFYYNKTWCLGATMVRVKNNQPSLNTSHGQAML